MQKNSQKLDKIQEQVHKLNLDQMKLLSVDSDFLQMVKEARKRFNIPPNGFSGDHSANQETFSISSVPNEEWKKVLKAFLDRFNLPSNFVTSIYRFIFTNKVVAPTSSFTTSTSIDAYFRRSVTIHFYRYPTEKEFKAIKEFLRRNIDVIKTKRRPRKNIDRDTEILKKSEGKGKAFYHTDREMTAYIADFEDKGEDIKSLTHIGERKQANIIKQVRHRHKKKR